MNWKSQELLQYNRTILECVDPAKYLFISMAYISIYLYTVVEWNALGDQDLKQD